MTHTYSVLEVPQEVFDEIKRRLEEVRYEHAFHNDGRTIDMHGIALEAEQPDQT